MQITLVYRGRYLVRQALELETLSSVLARAGHRLDFAYDPGLFGVTDNVIQWPGAARRLSSPAALARRVLRQKPDLILFSALSNTFAFLSETAGLVKQARDIPLYFLGLLPTLSPDTVMEHAWIDGLIQGEAEESAPALARALSQAGGFSGVPGLWFRENGRIIQNPVAAPVDLDGLPLPDKGLFFPWVTHRNSYAAMVSRGCPFSCSFCEETCSKGLYGPNYFRRKTVGAVIQELAAGRDRYGFKEVIFKDSYLNGDAQWLGDFCRQYKKHVQRPFKCFCTITGFSPSTARQLKDAGCYCVEFGLQTWNQGLRKTVLFRRETNDQAGDAFDACFGAGLAYDVDHMFHLPGETRADHEQGAVRYKSLSGLNRVKVHYLVVLPGAPIAEHPELPARVKQRAKKGESGDFYGQDAGNAEDRRTVRGFSTLYKLLPLLPGFLVKRLLKKDRVNLLSPVPGPLVAALQALVALVKGDRRFLIYALDYPRQVRLALAAAREKRGVLDAPGVERKRP